MQKQKLITKIENRVRELVPRLKGEDYLNELEREIEDKRNEEVEYKEDIIENEFEIQSLRDEIRNFIGHPIHLENILEAIINNQFIKPYTQTLEQLYPHIIVDLLSYNPSLTLQDQSLETLESLNQLLN